MNLFPPIAPWSAAQTMITPTLTGPHFTIMQAAEITAANAVNSFTPAYTTLQAGAPYGAVAIDNSTLTTAPVANPSTSTQTSVVEVSLK